MEWAQRTGVLMELNAEYQRRRREATRRGERFMDYGEVQSRLRRLIAGVAAGSKMTMGTLIEEVFDAP
jgi:hypothetical protein